MKREEEAEDWCFACKDGGDLILCDHKDCLKVYHTYCVESDTKKKWKCDWHFCFRCRRASEVQCFCCPISVCGDCISMVEFELLKGNKGFCGECLELIILANDEDDDSHMVDFQDRNTYEGLFMECWEILKEEEGLTMSDVYSVNRKLKKKKATREYKQNSVKKIRKREEDDGPVKKSGSGSSSGNKNSKGRKRVKSDSDSDGDSDSGKKLKGRKNVVKISEGEEDYDVIEVDSDSDYEMEKTKERKRVKKIGEGNEEDFEQVESDSESDSEEEKSRKSKSVRKIKEKKKDYKPIKLASDSVSKQEKTKEVNKVEKIRDQGEDYEPEKCDHDSDSGREKTKGKNIVRRVGEGKKYYEPIKSDFDTGFVKKKTKGGKKKVSSSSLEFIGWGSKPLIEFLVAIGKDVSTELSHYDVENIISEYIFKNKLLDQKRKRKVLCDAKLFSVFKKKTLHKHRIYSLLDSHFVENVLESEDDEECEEEEEEEDDEEENVGKTRKKQKVATCEGESEEEVNELVKKIQLSEFASIVYDNIKLVYLRRSLVEELVKEPESFETKVVGSFVRIKIDPKDSVRRNTHQLVQIEGIKKSATGEISKKTVLQVTNLLSEIQISALSDEDFTMEECEDLRQKMFDGILERPTVIELEKKAVSLHEDRTKHWIEKELTGLQNRINRANEKGWRKELYAYIERRELLSKPSEQERMLKTEPKVLADVNELDERDSLKSEGEFEENEVKEPASKVQLSKFASIVYDNMKLVYLKKSLVEELLKKPETFESKLVGSFVRIKTETKDIVQKNPYQLVQVEDIKKTSTSEISIKTLLQLSDMRTEIQISQLSDGDFTKEECDALRQKMIDGIVKRPTVIQLEKKAIVLHEDMTKHWIKKELTVLQSRINKANEKGKRKELSEYLDRRELLKKPSEQELMLKKVPKVLADVIDSSSSEIEEV